MVIVIVFIFTAGACWILCSHLFLPSLISFIVQISQQFPIVWILLTHVRALSFKEAINGNSLAICHFMTPIRYKYLLSRGDVTNSPNSKFGSSHFYDGMRMGRMIEHL